MFSFSTKKDHDSVVAVFDIGSASVGGALVSVRKNKAPKIIYSVRKQMAFKESLDIEKFSDSMIRTLNLVVSDIEKSGLSHLNFRSLKNKQIKEAFCFFSSPWYASQTQVIKVNKEKKFFVDSKMIDDLLEDEKKDFLSQKNDFFENAQVELMDSKIVQMRLNGYKVDNPYKKAVNSVEAEIFLSLIMSDVADRVEEVITRYFNVEKIHMHSFVLASFLCLRDTFFDIDDFVYLDVSGEVTDTSFVKNDSLRETETFPIGRNAFVRQIIKDFKTNYANASSMLNIYKDGKMDEANSKKIEKTIAKIRKDWVAYLEQAMFELSHGAILPRVVFVVADPDIGNLLIKIIREEKFVKLVFPDYNRSTNPILINPESLKDNCSFSSNVSEDVFLIIESLFIKRVVN